MSTPSTHPRRCLMFVPGSRPERYAKAIDEMRSDYLQPGADVSAAMAQITAASQTIVRRMPPGMIPPIILRYTASSVPVLQLGLDDVFIEHGDPARLLALQGLDAAGIQASIARRFADLLTPVARAA